MSLMNRPWPTCSERRPAPPNRSMFTMALVYPIRGGAEPAAAELEWFFRSASEHPDGRRLADSLDRAIR